MKFFLIALLLFPAPLWAYSQDPRSCADRRTQFPSNPPCQNLLVIFLAQ
ncbi:MAG: hypothetical protein NW214_04195 [Pseudanabaenaceae cyanobacterium bins.39]|nr:hypothetical protein [Pseudanabaenaceae cyanobacterium bins.39]